MEIKNIIQQKENESNETPVYIPSSSEKKRVILMYLFIGIMVYLSKKEINTYEYYHLKQATWWWILFILALVLGIVLLFVPVIKILWVLLLLLFVVSWGIGVKQARDGKYIRNSKLVFMDLFSGVWNWFLWLFEIGLDPVDPLFQESENTAKHSKEQKNEVAVENADEAIVSEWENTEVFSTSKLGDKDTVENLESSDILEWDMQENIVSEENGETEEKSDLEKDLEDQNDQDNKN